MSRRVFVDTWGWHALIDRRDDAHDEASRLVKHLITEGARLVSTDYVIDEACTLVKARSGSRAATRLLDLLDQTAALDLEWIGADRFERAKTLFRKYHDQAYSFTDCTSFVLMRELRIRDAMTADDHFRTAGFRILPGSRGLPVG